MARSEHSRPSEDHIRRTREYHDILVPVLRECARRCGYALTAHGSLERDIDLVAIPWIGVSGGVVEPASLAENFFAICEAVLGHCTWAGNWRPSESFEPPSGSLPNPERKPHGRLAWVIMLGVTYIDLSIMPTREEG